MKQDQPTEGHLEPEDVYGLVEKTLPASKRREVEEHLDRCDECVGLVANVLAANAPPSADEQAELASLPEHGASELLARLRPAIVATSPSSHRPAEMTWTRLVAAAAGFAFLALFVWWAHDNIIAPIRSRNLVARATTDLISLRQSTGRLPLRYIREFQRARVTRSGFDLADPEEQRIEETIESSLERAVALAPRDARTRTALGLFYLDAARLEEAETQLREAQELDSGSVEALNGLSVLFFDRALRTPERADELRREGLELLQRAYDLDRRNLMVLYNLAVYYQETGAPQEARRAWLAYTSQDGTSEWSAVARENLRSLGFR